MENTTQLFLAVRFNCNKCHDHPFERWTQDQYYQTAAYFAQIGLSGDPESKGRMVGGTDVEAPKPLFEMVADTGTGEVVHDRTKKVTAPKFPFSVDYTKPAAGTSRRAELAAWLTSIDNPYFARSYVNRLWGYLMGVGIIEPLDDLRAGNPASNPELLDYLTQEFVKSGFDARHVMRLICNSRTYQLSVATNKWNSDDKTNASHATARRLPAEVLLDAVYRVTGSVSKIPGVAPGTRAAALPDAGVELPSGFLTTFGRPARESACECERSSGLQLGPIMALVSGPTVADAIADPANDITKLAVTQSDDITLINELFLRILNRLPTAAEIETCKKDMAAVDLDHARMAQDLGRREAEFAAKRPALERQRTAAIATASAALAAYEKEVAPKLAAAERARSETIAKLEADLKTYETTVLPKKIADWEKERAASIVNRWLVLPPKATSATNRSQVTVEADGSVFVSGANTNGVVTVVAETALAGITGVRLEVLTDPRLPSNGPGRATDGNFVLNEIELIAAPTSDPKLAKPVKFATALADFSQESFDVAKAIDGNANDAGNGWAVYPRHRRHPLGHVRNRRAHRRPGWDCADVQAAPEVQQSLDAGPLPPVGHPRRQAGGLELARRVSRYAGHGARGPNRRPETCDSGVFPVPGHGPAGQARRRQRQQGTAPCRPQAHGPARPARVCPEADRNRPRARVAAARSRDERAAGRRPQAHSRSGHRLGTHQQPGISVQPLRRGSGWSLTFLVKHSLTFWIHPMSGDSLTYTACRRSRHGDTAPGHSRGDRHGRPRGCCGSGSLDVAPPRSFAARAGSRSLRQPRLAGRRPPGPSDPAPTPG